MSRGAPRIPAIAGSMVIVLSIGLLVAANVAARITGTTSSSLTLGAAIVLLGVVGGIVIIRRPANRMGMVLSAAGIAGALSGLAAGLGSGDAAHDALVGNSFLDAGPARLVAIAVGDAGFFVFFAATFGLLPLLFPDGRVPSPRWRWLQWFLICAGALGFVFGVFKPELCTYDPTTGLPAACVPNPIGIAGLPSTESLFGLLLPAVVLSLSALVVRFRRAVGVEHLQLKWLTFSMGAVLAEFFAGLLIVEVLGVDGIQTVALYLFGVFALMVPMSIAVAILRYRLYDIDRLVSRTVSYAIVVTVLGGVFWSTIAFMSGVVGGDSPSWVVAVSTLFVAASFDPLRRRVQRGVARRFDRSRYDAEQVVVGFGKAISASGGLSSVTASLGRVVSEAFHPASIAVWASGTRHEEQADGPAVTMP